MAIRDETTRPRQPFATGVFGYLDWSPSDQASIYRNCFDVATEHLEGSSIVPQSEWASRRKFQGARGKFQRAGVLPLLIIS